MNLKNHISSSPLPLGQNYKELRTLGMNFIQANSGVQWTNLNPSDPGVTFLDELCYALTELGYCTNFSIEDLLTNANGELNFEQQFYLPENILTSSPITTNDFRKYIIDCVPTVQNVEIQNENNKINVYLKLPPQVQTAADIDTISQNVLSSLDRTRNLGQYLEMPIVLSRIPFKIVGAINLNHPDDLYGFVSSIIKQTDDLIFPTVIPKPYDQIPDWEDQVDMLFSGPFLKRGAISDEDLGSKKDILSSFELVNLLRQLPQVKGVNMFQFVQTKGNFTTKISVTRPSELMVIDWIGSIVSNQLKLYSRGQLLEAADTVKSYHLEAAVNSINVNSEFSSGPSITGNYRDINTYYSIQETLPDIYGVGPNAIKENDTKLKKAQSRQLKGYLTLFDQTLANQFAQLANLGTLFSFNNVTVGAPSDFESYLSGKSKLDKRKVEYPAAFKSYAPTYFYQSIYAISDIRPLLKGFEAFDYTTEFKSSRQISQESWKRFKNDPYNPYMKGLMDLMTSENENLDRRNNLLNHLLARHGESPQVIDQIIEGSSYAGVLLKDQVIFKSLLLQNYGVLSYNRKRSYSVGFALELTEDYRTLEIPFDQYYEESENTDFVLNQKKIDRIEKITEQDCENFAIVELKLSLLMGIKPLYKEFILNYRETSDIGFKLSQLNWLIQEKRGVLLIESSLLKSSGSANSLEDLIFIFPGYATEDIVSSFKSRLKLCLAETLPVNLTHQLIFADETNLGAILLTYTKWFNMQLFKHFPLDKDEFEKANDALVNALNEAANE